ncbi:hypothetical protein [Sulfurovum sp.]|uniref:hypothetical protein n=1 Tax=Sulfurovum sp. TaxID=1969726 RepID=UPI0035660DE6
MRNINIEELKKVIEPHFYSLLDQDIYEVKVVDSVLLLKYNRFDLAFKILYLEMLNYDTDFSKHVYIEHIRAFSLGEFTEPGNENKNGIGKFIEDFKIIFENIQKNGFDPNQTLIPLSKNGSIVNGSHRVASAIVLNRHVNCVEINSNDHIYDYQFFYDRNVPNTILDAVATKFIEYAEDIYIALIWPTAVEKDEIIDKIIPNVVYKKKIKLNPNGAHNLISQIYYGEEWLGSIENNFGGAQSKVVECFKTFDSVRVIAFQATDLNEVLQIKQEIRDTFNIGKHSVHITDTKEEAIRTARIVFNANSIHFLNYAQPNKYISTHDKIEIFSRFIKKNNLFKEDLLLDSSLILSLYGLREAKDIDFFIQDNSKVKYHFNQVEIHDKELKYHREKKLELIYNQNFYFYFNDLKFISFDQLYRMKKNRTETKDINDCAMMEALIENNKFKEMLNKVKQIIHYEKIKFRQTYFQFKQRVIEFLKIIGLYNVLRAIYRKIRNRT